MIITMVQYEIYDILWCWVIYFTFGKNLWKKTYLKNYKTFYSHSESKIKVVNPKGKVQYILYWDGSSTLLPSR